MSAQPQSLVSSPSLSPAPESDLDIVRQHFQMGSSSEMQDSMSMSQSMSPPGGPALPLATETQTSPVSSPERVLMPTGMQVSEVQLQVPGMQVQAPAMQPSGVVTMPLSGSAAMSDMTETPGADGSDAGVQGSSVAGTVSQSGVRPRNVVVGADYSDDDSDGLSDSVATAVILSQPDYSPRRHSGGLFFGHHHHHSGGLFNGSFRHHHDGDQLPKQPESQTMHGGGSAGGADPHHAIQGNGQANGQTNGQSDGHQSFGEEVKHKAEQLGSSLSSAAHSAAHGAGQLAHEIADGFEHLHLGDRAKALGESLSSAASRASSAAGHAAEGMGDGLKHAGEKIATEATAVAHQFSLWKCDGAKLCSMPSCNGCFDGCPSCKPDCSLPSCSLPSCSLPNCSMPSCDCGSCDSCLKCCESDAVKGCGDCLSGFCECLKCCGDLLSACDKKR